MVCFISSMWLTKGYIQNKKMRDLGKGVRLLFLVVRYVRFLTKWHKFHISITNPHGDLWIDSKCAECSSLFKNNSYSSLYMIYKLSICHSYHTYVKRMVFSCKLEPLIFQMPVAYLTLAQSLWNFSKILFLRGRTDL